MKLDVSILLVLVTTTASEETTSARFLEEESMSADMSFSFNSRFMGMTTPMTMRKSKGESSEGPHLQTAICKDHSFMLCLQGSEIPLLR
jgi:hypothetical protein